jgi:hypothetical protein
MKNIFYLVAIAGILFARIAKAQDAFWAVSVRELKITEGAIPPPTTASVDELGDMQEIAADMQPYARYAGRGLG